MVHLHGKTGRFLEPAAGPPAGANILQMARPGLELHLAAVIRQAAASGEARRRNVRVQSNGDFVSVDLRARRVEAPRPLRGLVLVSFEVMTDAPSPPSGGEADAIPDQLLDVQRELEMTRESHQAAMEELETTNEELTSTNEELQSTNEELQSANEELETSREEMQSLNEELHTLNSEMQSKLDELSRANDDMQNLLNSTDVAVLFLDLELNVKRYTLQATKVFNLIPSDIGRPITDLVSKLQYDRMADDAREVLHSLVYREIEVRDRDDSWYLMRILPYRTQGNRVSGLVLTFFDTTKVKLLQQLESGLHSALERLPVTVIGQDRQLRIMWAHAGALALDSASLRGKTEEDFLPAGEAAAITALKRRVLETGVATNAEVAMTVTGRGATAQDLWVQPLRDGRGALSGLLSVAVDVTEKRADEQRTRALRAELAAALARCQELESTVAELSRDGEPGSLRSGT
jgi:two-component system CheB/CheR fusion protein